MIAAIWPNPDKMSQLDAHPAEGLGDFEIDRCIPATKRLARILLMVREFHFLMIAKCLSRRTHPVLPERRR
jgi:hypothetical protein